MLPVPIRIAIPLVVFKMEKPFSQVRVAVASDDRLLCDLLRVIGAEMSFPMANADDAAALRLELRTARPDVLLLDSRVEGALNLCSALKSDGGPAVILFMAQHDDDTFAVAALGAGARGIVARTCPADDLVKAVRVVHDGQIWARRQVLEARVEHLEESAAPAVAKAGLHERLSLREQEVFRHAAAGLSNKELAHALVISQATVKAHMTSIFQKLGLRGRNELAAAYHGILRPGPRPVPPRQLRRPA
jgi:DNA-binding NarL/FixJ family response regulator